MPFPIRIDSYFPPSSKDQLAPSAILSKNEKAFLAPFSSRPKSSLSPFFAATFALCFAQQASAETVSLEGLEVTQSIQVMSLSNPAINNTVPLIAEKRTIVRAYFSTSDTSVAIASGRFAMTHSAYPVSILFNMIFNAPSPIQVSSAENANLQAKRDTRGKSLDFVLPPHLTVPGMLTLSLQQVTGQGGSAVTCAGCNRNPLHVTFMSSPPLRVRLIGIRYERPMGSGTWFQPREIDFTLIQSWLKRAYPVASVEQPLPYNNVTYGGDLFAQEDPCWYANAQILQIRRTEVPDPNDPEYSDIFRTHYYGLIYDGGISQPNFVIGCSYSEARSPIPVANPDPEVTAVGPTGSNSYGWDFDGSYGDWYAGHELGHTFGRKHLLGGCGAQDAPASDADTSVIGTVSPNSPNEPYYVGFDNGDSVLNLQEVALPGSWHDIMTHCPQRWLGRYTYEGIRQRLLAENAPLIHRGPLPPGNISTMLESSEDKIPAGVMRTIPSGKSVKECVAESHDPATLYNCLDNLNRLPGVAPLPHTTSPEVAEATESAPESGPSPSTWTSTKPGIRVQRGSFLSIIATVNFKDGVNGHIHQTDIVKQIVVRSLVPDKRVHIRVTQSDGKVLKYPVHIRLNFSKPAKEQHVGLIDASIPYTDKIAKIELVAVATSTGAAATSEEQVLDAIDTTKPAPTIANITLPEFKTYQEFLETPLVIRWEAAGDTSDTLTYTVQVSRDDGRTWQTVAIGLTKPQLEIDPNIFEGEDEIRIKVITREGFRKEEKSFTLKVPQKGTTP